jgi:hypothetical protein
MDALEIIPAIVLSGIGTFFVVIFAKSILSAFPFSFRGLPDRMRLKRRQALLAQADQAIERDALPEACTALRGAFYLETVRLAPELIDKINNLHHAVLGRLVILSEKSGGLLANLPVVEDLLIRRGELLKEIDEVRRARSGLSRRSNEKGRTSANWAVGEYNRRLDELREKISTNRQSLESQLDTLFQSLRKAPASSEVTYH